MQSQLNQNQLSPLEIFFNRQPLSYEQVMMQ